MHKVLMNSHYQKRKSNILKWCVEKVINYLVPRCESLSAMYVPQRPMNIDGQQAWCIEIWLIAFRINLAYSNRL